MSDSERSSENAPSLPGPPSGNDHHWWGPEHVQSTSVLRPVAILLGRLKLVAGVTMSAAVVSLVLAMVLPKWYDAIVQFVPEKAGSGSAVPDALSGIAGQFGMQLDDQQGPDYYAKVLQSRPILNHILQSTIALPDPPPRHLQGRDSATVLEILKPPGRNAGERLFEGRKKLLKKTDTDVHVRTGIITFTVSWRDPQIAATMATLFMEELHGFNTRTRQSSARNERAFLQDRLAEVRDSLRAREEALSRFLAQNRRIDDSPELQAEQQRLQRDISIETANFQNIQAKFDEARLREVNDTPVLTIIAPPAVPEKKARPKRRIILMIGTFLGFVGGFGVALSADYLARARQRDDPDYLALQQSAERLRIPAFSRRKS